MTDERAERVRQAVARGDIHSVPLAKALAAADICPRCLGELDTGWECNGCGFDAADLIAATTPD